MFEIIYYPGVVIIFIILLVSGLIFSSLWFMDVKKSYKKQIFVVFRYDDFSSQSSPDLDEVIIQTLQNYRIPVTLGVIPNMAAVNALDPREQELVPLSSDKIRVLIEIRDTGFMEIAQHGYSHQTFREQTQGGFTEFVGMSYEGQLKRIKNGKAFLEERLGIEITTFIPPYDSYDSNTIIAVEATGFQILSAGLMCVPSESSGLRFLPATTDLLHLQEAIKVARRIPDPKPIITVLFHPYDFFDGLQPLTIQEFDKLLCWTSQQEDVRVLSIGQAVRLNNKDFGISQLNKNHEANQNTISIMPPFLKFFHPSVYLRIKTISRLRLISILLSIAFYFFISIFSIINARIVHSLISSQFDAIDKIYGPFATAVLLSFLFYVLRDTTMGYKGFTVLVASLSAIIGTWSQ